MKARCALAWTDASGPLPEAHTDETNRVAVSLAPASRFSIERRTSAKDAVTGERLVGRLLSNLC